MTSVDPRVCPRCGEPAGGQPFCGSCGLNLAQLPELPSAEEYAAKIREEQWLRRQAASETETTGGSDPLNASLASSPSKPRRSPVASRDRLIGWAGWVAAGCTALNVFGSLLAAISSVVHHTIDGFPLPVYAAVAVSSWVAFLSTVLTIVGLLYVGIAFFGPLRARAPRLVSAGWLLAGGEFASFVSFATDAGFLIGHHARGSASASVVFLALAALAAAVGFAVAASAFTFNPLGQDPRRDSRLAGASGVYAATGVFTVVACILALIANSAVPAISAGTAEQSQATAALVLVSGLIIAPAAILIAVSLHQSANRQRLGVSGWQVQRDRFIAGCAAALALAQLLAAIGLLLAAGQGGLVSAVTPGLTKVGNWLGAIGALTIVGAVGCAAVGFYISGWRREEYPIGPPGP